MIAVSGMTLTYPSGKGVFDLNFAVPKGVVTGYLGPNGAGKTTTIRALLGFMRPNSGSCSILGLDCQRSAPAIQKKLGYIPGEIAFPVGMDGDEFLSFMNDMRGSRDLGLQAKLLDMFELSPKGRIRKFSKGTKQKLAIVAAFMHDPEVLILDEPTSGLDPLMQNRFVELVLSEKARGKTILMSSHNFEEVEKTCDSVLIIKNGRIIRQASVEQLRSTQRRVFSLATSDNAALSERLGREGYGLRGESDGTLTVFVAGGRIDNFLKTASQFTVLGFSEKHQSLEDIFIEYYGKEAK
jgi:ABC-2 type transport system ATP-binding protein